MISIFVEIPNCDEIQDCGSCAQKEECVWCASNNSCRTVSKAFDSTDCDGLVFEPPCPDSFISGIFLVYSYLIFFSRYKIARLSWTIL